MADMQESNTEKSQQSEKTSSKRQMLCISRIDTDLLAQIKERARIMA